MCIRDRYSNGQPEDLLYIPGRLNSRLSSYRFSFLGKLLGGGVYEYYENTVSKLRIPRRPPGDPIHDEIVSLVERRMEAEADRRSTQIESERQLMEASAQILDDKINNLTESLFGLTEEEQELLRQWEAGRAEEVDN